MKKIIMLSLIGILCCSCFSCMNTKTKTETNSSSYSHSIYDDFEAVKIPGQDSAVTLEVNSFGAYVNGSLKNISDKDYSIVMISFGLYDKNGTKVGTAIDTIRNLKSGETWKFRAVGTGQNIDGCELDEISGY